MERFGEKQLFRKLIFRFLEVKSLFPNKRFRHSSQFWTLSTRHNSVYVPLLAELAVDNCGWKIVGGHLDNRKWNFQCCCFCFFGGRSVTPLKQRKKTILPTVAMGILYNDGNTQSLCQIPKSPATTLFLPATHLSFQLRVKQQFKAIPVPTIMWRTLGRIISIGWMGFSWQSCLLLGFWATLPPGSNSQDRGLRSSSTISSLDSQPLTWWPSSSSSSWSFNGLSEKLKISAKVYLIAGLLVFCYPAIAGENKLTKGQEWI